MPRSTSATQQPRTSSLPPRLCSRILVVPAGVSEGVALRDALLEAGQTELAEHFGGDEPHPRGCWALDVIGGRT